MSALQLLTMLQLKRKLLAHSFIIHSWVFFCITSIYFDLLDYSNKLRGHMQTNTAQCSGLVQETILLTKSCQKHVFYKLHVTFCQDYFKKCFLSIVIISFNKTPNQCAAINQVFISNRFSLNRPSGRIQSISRNVRLCV